MSQYILRYQIFIFAFSIFLSACSSKIPYGSTYYFPLEPKTTSAQKDIEPARLHVSLEKVASIKPSVATKIEKAQLHISQLTKPVPKEVAINIQQEPHTELSKKELKKVIKARKKAVKAQIKQVKKQQKQAQQGLTKNLRNGIILGAVGLIMMIIFGAAGIGVLVGIGAIVLVVGLVFILLDLLEV